MLGQKGQPEATEQSAALAQVEPQLPVPAMASGASIDVTTGIAIIAAIPALFINARRDILGFSSCGAIFLSSNFAFPN